MVSDSIILHHMPENIRKALDEVNISRGSFANLQKAFDTADHQIPLAKLDYHRIRRFP